MITQGFSKIESYQYEEVSVKSISNKCETFPEKFGKNVS